MTIEVRELVIRASVTGREDDAVSAAALAEALRRLEGKLVQACVARVLEELRQLEER